MLRILVVKWRYPEPDTSECAGNPDSPLVSTR